MINEARLKASLEAMARLGETPRGGIHRLALTDADRASRELFVRWLEEANLDVRCDDAGNLYGRRPGIEATAKPVVAGSHLDSVANGGKYDGTLGVLAALEVVRTLNDHGIPTRHPIEVVSFTNEEGARFTPAMLGSGMATGVFSREWTYARTDPNGLRFEDELRRIGYLGSAEHRPGQVEAYIELHIEQGPYLEQANVNVGLVRSIVCAVWMEVTFRGQADHAGPTPMHMRRDALLASAQAIAAVRRIAASEADLVGTVGRINARPNLVNVIPDVVEFTVDFRHPSETVVDGALREFRQQAEAIARQEGVELVISELWRMKPTPFSDRILQVMKAAARARGYRTVPVVSWAGHDSRYMATKGDAAMIFVQTKDGKSHCEEEEAPWEAIGEGANLLLDTVAALAQTQEPQPVARH